MAAGQQQTEVGRLVQQLADRLQAVQVEMLASSMMSNTRRVEKCSRRLRRMRSMFPMLLLPQATAMRLTRSCGRMPTRA